MRYLPEAAPIGLGTPWALKEPMAPPGIWSCSELEPAEATPNHVVG